MTRAIHASSTRWPRWAPVAAFALSVLSVSYLYGLLTGGPPFGTVALWEGWVRCLESGPLPCEHIGHPIGVDANVASSLIYGAFGLTRLGLSVSTALNLLAIASIVGGWGALWYLGRRLTGGDLAGALSGALYFASPLVLQHVGLFQLFLGFALLPVPTALVVVAIDNARHDRRSLARAATATAALLAAGLILVFLDPYPWVVAIALAAPVAVVFGALATRERCWWDLGVALVLLGALAFPGAMFRVVTAGEGLETEMPRDFYRGMGVDVGVALIPTTTSTLGDLLSVGHRPWRAIDFTGDGSQLSSSYLGLPLLALASTGAVVLARRRDAGRIAIALVAGGGACLLLSLGPSLKVVDRDPTPRGDPIVFGDYLMPPEDATVDLPWGAIFDRQPFASMRATYRWQSGGRVVLVLLAGVGIAALARRRPGIALAIAVILVLDAAPTQLWDRRDVAEAHEVELQTFVRDMQVAYADRLEPGERVLFLPAENDYLVQYIAPVFDVRAYNLSFDKAIVQVRPKQPPPVIDAITSASASQLSREQLCGLFRDDLVDAVVFNEFSLRWDSYRWPPAPDRRREEAAKLAASGLLETEGLVVDRGPLAVITRADPGGACAPG